MEYQKLLEDYRSVNSWSEGVTGDSAALFVQERFSRMAYAKQEIRQVWQGTHDLYYCNDWEWIVAGEGFERPVRFPTLRDFVKSLVDVFMKDPPGVMLRARKPEEEGLITGKKAYIDHILNTTHEKSVRRQVVEDMFFYGKGIRRPMYCRIDKNGETIFNDVATRRVDPRNFFIDENAIKLHDKTGFQGARDALERVVMPWSTFQKLYGHKNLGGVMPENYFQMQGLDYMVTNSRELAEKTPVMAVKVYEYENQELDLYIVVAGGKTIEEGSLKKKKGTWGLDWVDYNFEPRNDSSWGNNLAQLIAPHIYLKDTLFNLELQNLKLTLQPVVAMSGDFGYNPTQHFVQPGGVWVAGSNLNGKISDHIQPLVVGNPNTRVQDTLQNINSELSITTRADLRSMEYYQNKTATEVVRQNQAMNAHNETIEAINEIESEGVLVEKMLEIMKEFMPAKDEKGEHKRVPIRGYIVERGESPDPLFKEKAGYKTLFELTDNIIDVECDIEVEDRRTLLAKNNEKLGRILQVLPLISNMGQLDPQILQRINFSGLVEQVIEAVGLDMERSLNSVEEEYADEFEEVKEEIMLGHDVEVPDETRKLNLARLKYFMVLADMLYKEGNQTQKDAIGRYLDKISEAITEDKIKKREIEKADKQFLAMQQGMPQQAQQGVSSVGTPGQASPMQIRQPDANLLQGGAGEVAKQLV